MFFVKDIILANAIEGYVRKKKTLISAEDFQKPQRTTSYFVEILCASIICEPCSDSVAAIADIGDTCFGTFSLEVGLTQVFFCAGTWSCQFRKWDRDPNTVIPGPGLGLSIFVFLVSGDEQQQYY